MGTIIALKSVRSVSIKYADIKGEYIVPVIEVGVDDAADRRG